MHGRDSGYGPPHPRQLTDRSLDPPRERLQQQVGEVPLLLCLHAELVRSMGRRSPSGVQAEGSPTRGVRNRQGMNSLDAFLYPPGFQGHLDETDVISALNPRRLVGPHSLLELPLRVPRWQRSRLRPLHHRVPRRPRHPRRPTVSIPPSESSSMIPRFFPPLVPVGEQSLAAGGPRAMLIAELHRRSRRHEVENCEALRPTRG